MKKGKPALLPQIVCLSIPTYTLHNPVSLLWTWHFKQGVYAIFSIFLTNFFVMVFTRCGEWLGRNIVQRLASRKLNEHFFHVNKTYCCVSC